MGHLSNKFFNLMVLILVVPVIIAALDASNFVSAASSGRMQRRSAFLAPEDSVIEARGLSEDDHELFGRDLTDDEMTLVARDPSRAGHNFVNFVKGAFHAVVGRSIFDTAVDEFAPSVKQRKQRKESRREIVEHPVSSPGPVGGNNKAIHSSSHHNRPVEESVTVYADNKMTSVHDQLSHLPEHGYNRDEYQRSRAYPENEKYLKMGGSHDGTTVREHRRSLYYDMEDLD